MPSLHFRHVQRADCHDTCWLQVLQCMLDIAGYLSLSHSIFGKLSVARALDLDPSNFLSRSCLLALNRILKRSMSMACETWQQVDVDCNFSARMGGGARYPAYAEQEAVDGTGAVAVVGSRDGTSAVHTAGASDRFTVQSMQPLLLLLPPCLHPSAHSPPHVAQTHSAAAQPLPLPTAALAYSSELLLVVMTSCCMQGALNCMIKPSSEYHSWLTLGSIK